MAALVVTIPLVSEPYYLVFRPDYGFRCLPQMPHVRGDVIV